MTEGGRRAAHALLLAVFAASVFVALSGGLGGCACVDYYQKCEYDPKCCVAPQACTGELPKKL